MRLPNQRTHPLKRTEKRQQSDNTSILHDTKKFLREEKARFQDYSNFRSKRCSVKLYAIIIFGKSQLSKIISKPFREKTFFFLQKNFLKKRFARLRCATIRKTHGSEVLARLGFVDGRLTHL